MEQLKVYEFESLHDYQQKASDAIDKMVKDGVDRDQQAMDYLVELYTKKFGWANKALVYSLSMHHYDSAISLGHSTADLEK